jgi:transcriptional regulator with XRE-family HTH domain
MDDQRIARLLRAIRQRRGWRQVDLGDAVGASQSSISRLEQGKLDGLTVGTLRRVADSLGASIRIDVLWRGGLGEQLMDERHAAMGVAVTRTLQAMGWKVLPEVTFQRFAERGSIDLLGVNEGLRAICILELKSIVRSYEETQRRLDVKARLARGIAEQRLGWRPRTVGVVLVIHDTSTNRGRVSAIGPLLRAGLPSTSREVRRWFADPSGPLRGVWFLTLPSRDARRREAPATGSGRPPRGRPRSWARAGLPASREIPVTQVRSAHTGEGADPKQPTRSEPRVERRTMTRGCAP